MTKNWIVFVTIDNAGGFEDIDLGSFETEEEAQAKVAELEAEDIEEYGEVVDYYAYYNINE